MDSQEMIKLQMIDDEPEICWMVKRALADKGFEVQTAFRAEQGLEMVEKNTPDLVLLDLILPGMDGLEVLQKIKTLKPDLPVIILSAYEDIGAAVKAMKSGAYDYIHKPVNLDEILITLQNALKTRSLHEEVNYLKQQINQPSMEPMVWSCPGMQKVMDMVNRIARYDVAVLVRGESGTGKELVADYLHRHSPRAARPLISIDCSALPESLVESELFGYEKGAFTGAHNSKPGRFELAQSGTLFLDEIGNLPLGTQVKLLRVLQERKLQRLGGQGEIEIDVRVITATNIDLEAGMRAGNFREDLYHRLNEFSVEIPPLRERGAEIEVLARHFLEHFNRQFEKNVQGFAPGVMAAMQAHPWPGNVRELMNAIKRAVVLAEGIIGPEHMPLEAARTPANAPVPQPAAVTAGIRPLKEICQEATRRVEREAILQALQETRWNKVKTARMLKINYKTLFNKMRELGI